MIKYLFGILVIVSVNVINRVMLEIICWTMKIISAGKKLVDKLVEECTETVEEVNHNESKHKCNSCTLYIVLFSTIFTAIIGIATYFVYSHWCLKKYAPRAVFGTRTQETISLLSL